MSAKPKAVSKLLFKEGR